MYAKMFRAVPEVQPALATDLEPVCVRLRPRSEAIRATAKHHRNSSPWPPKSAIVKAVAHLSIGMMERYALKELSEAEMLRFEKHVARCPKCRDHLDEELGWAAAMRSPFKRHVEKLIEAERVPGRCAAGRSVAVQSSKRNGWCGANLHRVCRQALTP